MRKSGWAAAGLGSLVLLLSACGGSGSSTPAAISTSTSASQSTSASASASSSTSTTPATGSSSSNGTTTQPTPTPHHTAGPQPSSNTGNESIPAVGTMILTIRNTPLGQVLVEASGYVVYTYAKDPKNGAPTCTGSCNTTWVPVIGKPQVTQGVTIPGSFAVVTTPSGKKQVTYNGKPLYTYKDAGPLVTTGNGVGGVWYVVKV
jgi:predicted lipoprotein with Yx(FWY)xxD motif